MRAILRPSFRNPSSVGVDRAKRTAALLVLVALLALLSKALLPPGSLQLQCAGRMSSKYGPAPATVFVNLARPAWALREWGDSKGSFRLELPQVAIVNYRVLRDEGDLLELATADEEGRPAGTFAIPTGDLTVHTPQGAFRGNCQTRSD